MATLAPDAIHGEFVRLAHAGLASHEYARAGMRVLRRAVAFDAAAAVWFDPTAALPVDKWIDDSMIDDAGLHLAEIELDAADIAKFRELGASGRRAARLSEAIDGKPDGGRGHRESRGPVGWATSSGPWISATPACGAGSCCIVDRELPPSRPAT